MSDLSGTSTAATMDGLYDPQLALSKSSLLSKSSSLSSGIVSLTKLQHSAQSAAAPRLAEVRVFAQRMFNCGLNCGSINDVACEAQSSITRYHRQQHQHQDEDNIETEIMELEFDEQDMLKHDYEMMRV